ncbi:MSCRAMM family protein [Pseudomarimonas arenosa]|uniref:Carboxypeptidase regulatory-like domain-containing protein n=1 Tax=Pseudomarimonas arenosa TaxID=2774145 RepID=A0AAW3ZQ52_9GAMM|nr:carboxypeptidase regulatory-like domain-containing protein [Pseudomarimonas arenosa]MBD8527614.1 carboxypeptidase regulatory-like domain-containing protein [Pseudomarimonas arenosa]
MLIRSCALISALLMPCVSLAQADLNSLQAEHAALQRHLSGIEPMQLLAVDKALDPQASGAVDETKRRKQRSVDVLREIVRQSGAASVTPQVALPVMRLAAEGGPGASCYSAVELVEKQGFKVELASSGLPRDALWLRWQAPAAGTYLLSTRGSELDTHLTRFGDCADQGQSALDESDDQFGLNAELGFSAEYAGQPFYFKLRNLSARGDALVTLGSSRRISGRVTKAATGGALPGVGVSVTQQGFSYPESYAWTDSQGDYSIYPYNDAGVRQYYVRTARESFADREVLHQIWPGRTCAVANSSIESCPQGDEISLRPNEQRQAIDFSLPNGATIMGRVLNANTGQPIAGASVRLYDSSGNQLEWLSTDTAGRYRAVGLSPGNYYATSSAYTFASVLYGDTPCGDSCHVLSGQVIVVDSQIVEEANFSLPPLAYLEVSLSIDGQRVESESFYNGFRAYLTNGVHVSVSRYWDSATRKYLVGPLNVGTYRIQAKSDNTFGQLLGGVNCVGDCQAELASSQTVQISSAGDRPQISFDLKSYPKLSGRILADDGVTPIVDAQVRLLTPSGSHHSAAYTDSSGYYRFARVIPGTLFIHARASGYFDMISPNVECESATPLLSCPDAQSMVFDLSTDDQQLNFELRESPRIRIALTEAGASIPVQDFWYSDSIRVINAEANTVHSYSYFVDPAGGRLEISDLAVGDYRVAVRPTSYHAQFVGGSACAVPPNFGDFFSLCDAATAQVFSLHDDDLEGSVELSPLGVRRAQVVRDSDGSALSGVAIDSWNDQGLYLGTRVTDVHGRVKLGGSEYYWTYPEATWISTDNYYGLVDQVYSGIHCAAGTSVYKGGCGLSGGTSISLPELDPNAAEIVFRLQAEPPSTDVFSSGFE